MSFTRMSADEMTKAILYGFDDYIYRNNEDRYFLYRRFLERFPQEYRAFVLNQKNPALTRLSLISIWSQNIDNSLDGLIEALDLDELARKWIAGPSWLSVDKASDEESKLLSQKVFQHDFSAILYDYNELAHQHWLDKAKPGAYLVPEGKNHDLLSFLYLRQYQLGIDFSASLARLYSLGWQPENVFMAYLEGAVYSNAHNPSMPLDIVAEAVRAYPQQALSFLDIKNYKHYSSYSYPKYMLAEWIHFLFRYCDMPDRSFLQKEHRQKNLSLLCVKILEEKENPDIERKRLEDRLQAAGLLDSENPIELHDAKLRQMQKVALIDIYVFHYQYRFEAWQKTFAGTPVSVHAKSLIWGLYEQDKLKTAFMLNQNEQPEDENGRTILPEPADRIGLVHASELDGGQIAAWNKVLKAKRIKQPFSQLAPVQELLAEELDGKVIKRFFGAVTKHKTIEAAASGWRLFREGTRYYYSCYHLTDKLHKYGAQLTFSPICAGSEYAHSDVSIRNVIFYKASELTFKEDVPQSAVVHPDALPKRFVQTALKLFAVMAGMDK